MASFTTLGGEEITTLGGGEFTTLAGPNAAPALSEASRLSLTIGSSVIPLLPGISFPLVLRSPIFPTSEGKIPGSYIFNTSLPATDELKREFAQAHRISRHGRATAELDYVLKNGIFKYQGKCTVVEANPMSYEVAFKVDNGDWASALAGKSLKDLDLGGDRTIADVFSVAHDNDGFTRDVSNGSDFVDEYAPPFTHIDTDFAVALNSDATVFTAPAATSVHLYFNFFFIPGNGENPMLKIYRNSEATPYSDMAIIPGMNKFETVVTVAEGDEIRVKISVEAVTSGGDFNVTYDLYMMYLEYNSGSNFDNVANGDQDSEDFALFPIQNEKLLSNFPDDAFELDNLSLKTLYTEYFKVINYYRDGRFPLFMQGELEDEVFYSANLFTPMVYMKKLVEQIATEAGYRVINNPFDDDDFTNAVLFNAYAQNNYTGADTRILPIKTSFNLIDHVPDVKQSEFISWICRLTGTVPVVDNNQLTVTFIAIRTRHQESVSNESQAFPGVILDTPVVKVDSEYAGISFQMKESSKDQYLADRIKPISDKLNYKGEVEGITSLPAIGNEVNDYYFVTKENSFYVWQYNPEIYSLGWWFLSKDFPLEYSEGEEPYLSLSCELSPVLTSLMQDTTMGAPENRFWNIPVTWQPGILEGFPESLSAEYGIQVLRYMGLHPDSLGDDYPLGSSWMKNYDGDTLTGIDLNAESIFNNRYKEFLQWLAYDAKPVKLRALLTPAQLKGLDITKIQRYHNYSFLIKELKVNLLYDHLSIAELDVYVC